MCHKLESKYFKYRTIENKSKYKKQNNCRKRLYKKGWKNFCYNLEPNGITDNKIFCTALFKYV